MTERPEFKRLPRYYHAPKNFEELLGEERFYYLFGGIISQTFLNPPYFSRVLYGNMLWELHNEPNKAREDGYDSSDILNSIVFLQEWSTMFGFILGGEIEAIQNGKQLEPIDPTPKYVTWNELLSLSSQWKETSKVVGLAHGAFDPPHIGHSRLSINVWPYCDILIYGFDRNTMLRARKGEDRPRFPQLAWRMWEIALLPTIDYVFVIPLDEPESEKFEKVYRQLGVRVIGTSKDNPLLPEYERRMKKLGGRVISEFDRRQLFTSTRLVADLSDEDIARRTLLSIDNLEKRASQMEEIALAAGYLRDYPDGT